MSIRRRHRPCFDLILGNRQSPSSPEVAGDPESNGVPRLDEKDRPDHDCARADHQVRSGNRGRPAGPGRLVNPDLRRQPCWQVRSHVY